MGISLILKSLLNIQKKIDINKLPSQALFYKDDFEIFIKKADIEDIIQYEYKYEKEDIGQIISKIKNVVENNVILSKNYKYIDIKSVDIIFIFLEIVKFTTSKSISIEYFNDEIGEKENIDFGCENFNYFEIPEKYIKMYNTENKEFNINGFRYSLPSIGIENSLTNFLVSKSDDIDALKYNDYSYDFLYFLGNKNTLKFSEIENLIQIFNFDISDEDKNSISIITKSFSNIQKYSLLKNDRVIDITSKINLENIWR